MKKLIRTLLVSCMMLLCAQTAFADQVTIPEGADISDIHRLAIASPQYVPYTALKDPSKEEVLAAVYKASEVARCYVLSYDTIAQNIAQDKKIDLTGLDRREASKVYKENVAAYADAYVVLTVANDKHVVCFYDVYRAGTNELLYSYRIGAYHNGDRDAATYQTLTERFYKQFEDSAESQQKKKAEEAKKAAKEAKK